MSKLSFVLSLVLSLCFVGTAMAQMNLSLGPRIGFNASKIVGDDAGDVDASTGLVLGLSSTYSINEKTGLGIDLLYSQEGASLKGTDLETDLDYLRIPVTFQFFFRGWEDDFRPKVYAGLAPGFLLSAESAGNDIKEDINSFDLAGVLGLGFNYRLTQSGVWLNTDFRYLPGLTQLANVENPGDTFNQSLQFSVGVLFGLNQ